MIKTFIGFIAKCIKNYSVTSQNNGDEIPFPILCEKFVRGVGKAKWNNQLSEGSRVVSADAITSCLRTSKNEMSVWSVDNIEDAVLALVSTRTSISIIDVIELDAKRLKELKLSIRQKDAETPAEKINDRHYDIVNLDYITLGVIADEIVSEVLKDKEYIKRYSVKVVKKILEDALANGKINIESLNEKLQNKLKK